MSPFPVREPRRPEPSALRVWLEPLAVGAAGTGAIAGVAFLLGGNSVFLPLLLPVLAAVLGWRWGFRRGAVASCAPIAALAVGELVREALGGTGGSGAVGTLTIAVAVILILGFCAFLAAAIRGRYRRPPTGPEGPRGSDYASTSPWRS